MTLANQPSGRPGIASAPTIATAMESGHDNFTVLRLALALAVVVSHAGSVMTGAHDGEPLIASTGFSLGEHAVNGFFTISGFLVTMSFLRRGFRDYLLARLLRIAPALIAAALFCALVIGPALTSLPVAAYLVERGTWTFLVQTLTSFRSNVSLPGLFEHNPLRLVMGTVWTLRYEVFCYAGVLLAGVAGLLVRPRLALVVVGALLLAVAALDGFAPGAGKATQTSLRLSLLFAGGSLLYQWRDTVRLSWLVALGLFIAVVLARETAFYRALLFSAEIYAVLVLALHPALPDIAVKPDFSYGAYLYGWPVQQSLASLFPTAGATVLLWPALTVTLGLAALSWFLVEKPALSLKARLLRSAPGAASGQLRPTRPTARSG